MHKRTKACAIPKEVKEKVYERDHGLCIFCKMPGLPEAHVISRSHSGRGIEQNIVTACRKCHNRMDNSSYRKEYQEYAIEYLKQFYPDWKKEDVIYSKWGGITTRNTERKKQ